jgi:hypothetical protein
MGEKTPDVQACPRILVETLRSVVLISSQPTMIGNLGKRKRETRQRGDGPRQPDRQKEGML